MQNGSIMRTGRQSRPDVWEFRWREPGPDGKRKHRRMVIGSVDEFTDESAVHKSRSHSSLAIVVCVVRLEW